jgi:hypothetical protein
MQKLLSSILLYSELLFDGTYFPSSIRIKVRLLKFLDETFYFFESLLDGGVLAFDPQADSGGGLDTDGSVEVVVAVFELFDQNDRVVVAAIEFSAHKYNLASRVSRLLCLLALV